MTIADLVNKVDTISIRSVRFDLRPRMGILKLNKYSLFVYSSYKTFETIKATTVRFASILRVALG